MVCPLSPGLSAAPEVFGTGWGSMLTAMKDLSEHTAQPHSCMFVAKPWMSRTPWVLVSGAIIVETWGGEPPGLVINPGQDVSNFKGGQKKTSCCVGGQPKKKTAYIAHATLYTAIYYIFLHMFAIYEYYITYTNYHTNTEPMMILLRFKRLFVVRSCLPNFDVSMD